MFRKKVEFDDERKPMPVIVEMLIAVVFLAGLFLAAYKLSDWNEKREMTMQYGTRVENEY